jgi:alpha-galactosidase
MSTRLRLSNLKHLQRAYSMGRGNLPVLLVMLATTLSSCLSGHPAAERNPALINVAAPTPPMGWNSYDYFGAAVTEAEFKAEVEFLKENLLEYGWNYAVIDYLWFNPTGSTSVHPDKDGKPRDTLAMDAYGRLMPAVNRFPSAANGKGFKPIAEYVHDKGLKFGIHIMRGIPRQAYWEKRPIFGTAATAHDIADTLAARLCWWNNNMYGVDTASLAGQAYYNSIVDLYASWDVDFLKVDDIAAPPYREAEIEMIRMAIDRCGRPIVLSLSPGDTPLASAIAVSRQANMWRVSNDMWDKWSSLLYQFERLDQWSPYIQRNRWPDADMLPLGHLSRGGKVDGPERMSRFTMEETSTLLTLWAMARSPLIMGGDLLTTPESIISLLQNREFLRVDQYSRDNRQVMRDSTRAVWIAHDSLPGITYLAIFNLEKQQRIVDFAFNAVPELTGAYKAYDIWKGGERGNVEGQMSILLAAHGAGFFKLVRAQ